MASSIVQSSLESTGRRSTSSKPRRKAKAQAKPALQTLPQTPLQTLEDSPAFSPDLHATLSAVLEGPAHDAQRSVSDSTLQAVSTRHQSAEANAHAKTSSKRQGMPRSRHAHTTDPSKVPAIAAALPFSTYSMSLSKGTEKKVTSDVVDARLLVSAVAQHEALIEPSGARPRSRRCLVHCRMALHWA